MIIKKEVFLGLFLGMGMQFSYAADDLGDKGGEKVTFSAVEAYVDVLTGKISEEDLKKEKALEGKDIKVLLERELGAMKSDPARLRLLGAKEFSAYVENKLVSAVVSSAGGSSLIGVSAGYAYVETRYFLGSGRSYVVIVRGPVEGLSAKAEAYLKGKRAAAK